MFHVSMLQKYTPDPTHVVDWGEIIVDIEGTLEEGPVYILDNQDQVLRRKTLQLVKVIWQHREVKEAIWEREDTMRATYHFLFEDKGVLSNIWHYNNYCICMCLCVLVDVNFEDEILIRGAECKTREKFNISQHG